jgi:ABC-2 type transport system ATP-binding protein
MQSFVNIKGLTKNFPGMDKPAINNLSADVYSGKITGLVGPDGAGKTTTIRHIIGLMHADEGEILVDSLDYKTDSNRTHTIAGYMPQKFGLYEDLTVIENLKLYADLRNVASSKQQHKFEKLLQFTDLKSCQNRLANALSGGMKQKLGLACALIGEPKLLLLDEPTVGVDPISRRELWHMVSELIGEGMAVLWATAYLDEAEKCDQVILLNEGVKLYAGPPAELLQNLNDRVWLINGVKLNQRRIKLMKFLREKEVIDGVIQGGSLRIVLDHKNSAIQKIITRIDKKLKYQKTAPRFEDAFIDKLGGGSGGDSKLAQQLQQKPDDKKIVIDAHHLTKKFGSFTAVADNDFKIRRGEIFGLLGPNGAGKSTTFKMMCGLLQPTSGEAFVMGLNLKTATSQARSKIGYMAQKFSLYSDLNVMQNLNFFSGLYGLSGQIQKKQINLMIELFDFQQYLKINAGILPLGYKQRLALACAVMHQPDIMFLDEPTSGVDPITRREFWTHINAMVAKGVTVMVTTHFMDEAEYCDRIALIYRGKNIASGTPEQLKQEAADYMHEKEVSLEEAFIHLVDRNNIEHNKLNN